MPSKWLVIHHADGREFEVLASDYKSFGAEYWPGFEVVGHKSGEPYKPPKSADEPEVEAESAKADDPKQKAAAKAAVEAAKK